MLLMLLACLLCLLATDADPSRPTFEKLLVSSTKGFALFGRSCR